MKKPVSFEEKNSPHIHLYPKKPDEEIQTDFGEPISNKTGISYIKKRYLLLSAIEIAKIASSQA